MLEIRPHPRNSNLCVIHGQSARKRVQQDRTPALVVEVYDCMTLCFVFLSLLNCLQKVFTCPGCCWVLTQMRSAPLDRVPVNDRRRIRLVITWLIVWLCVCRSVYKTCFHVQDAADTIAVSLSCARQSARKELEEKEKVIKYLTDYFVCVCLNMVCCNLS